MNPHPADSASDLSAWQHSHGRTLYARYRRGLGRLLTGLCVLLPLMLAFALFRGDPLSEITRLGVLSFMVLGLLLLFRRGMDGVAAYLAVALLIVATTYGVTAYGSVRGATALGYFGAVLVAGLFLRRAALIIVMVIIAVLIGLVAWAQTARLLPHPTFEVGFQYWLIMVVAVVSLGFGVFYSRKMTLEALHQQNDELARRELAELELQSMLDRYARIFQHSPTAIVVHAMPERRVLDVNPAFEKIYGYAREEFVGTIGDEMLWADPSQQQAFHRQLLQSGSVANFSARGRRKDGSEFAARVDSGLEAAGARGLAVSIIADVSAEVQVREDLRRAEDRFAKAFRLSPMDMTISRLSDGTLLEVSGFEKGIQGRTKLEIKGRKADTVGIWPVPGERERFVAELKARGVLTGYEITTYTRRGEPVNSRLWSTLIEIEGEECVLTASINVTDEKRRDREIEKLHDTLESRVRERTAQLEAVNAELDSFAYSVAHDLKSPLRAIDGFTRLLGEQMQGRLQADDHELFGRVLAATKRMNELIADLLALARVSQGQLELGHVDLSLMMNEVLQAMREREPQREVLVSVESGIVARCDGKLARIVLENLISNAWKYTRRAHPACIEFGSLPGQVDRRTVLLVRDNGVGFNMDYASTLFKPFHRLHHGTEFEGAGIGLATVHRILERHGGHIRCEAEEGVGACFYFSFEAAQG